MARAIFSRVRILILELYGSGLSVSESVVHESTVAALIALRRGAVDKLLLGERDEAAVSDLVSAFDGSSSRESPARTAAALVLNGSHSTLFVPVDGGR